MASFSCSLIISWSKQPANFQSFTELDRGGIQNNSNWITARRILVTSSDELDAQIFLQNNRTNVYINQYIWYNIYMEFLYLILDYSHNHYTFKHFGV